MREHTHAGMSLYGSAGSRKYLNAAERRRFAKAALRTPLEVQLFCIVLSLTGGRISEILAVTPAAIDIDSGVVNIVTLKRRKRGMVWQVPLPRSVIGKLEITPSTSATSTRSRYCLSADLEMEPNDSMAAGQGSHGGGPCYGYASHAKGIAPRLWRECVSVAGAAALGAALARACIVTYLYADVIGPEERAFATRMWANIFTDRTLPLRRCSRHRPPAISGGA